MIPALVPARGRVRSARFCILLVLLALILVAGCGLQRTRLSPGSSSPHDWQLLGGNTANQGTAAGPTTTDAVDTLLWRRKVSAIASAEPMIRGGLLFYQCADGHLDIYDARTGARLARTDFKGPITGVLFDDSGFVISTDQNERRLIFMRYNPFERRREVRIPSSSVAPCRLDDGTLIVASINGVVARYDTLGNTLWTIDTKAPIAAAPVRADSLVLIASGRNMVARRIRDGSQVWSHQASGAILSPAALGDHAYFGSTDSLVYAINLTTGTMQWFFPTRGQIVVPPVIGTDRVYVASNDGRIYALGMATGDTLWTFDTGGPLTTRPTLIGRVLFVGTQTGQLVMLESDTGTQVRSFKLEGPATTAPIPAAGRVYIADNKRRLHCFGVSSATNK